MWKSPDNPPTSFAPLKKKILLSQKDQVLNWKKKTKNGQVEGLNVKSQPRIQPNMVPGPQFSPPSFPTSSWPPAPFLFRQSWPVHTPPEKARSHFWVEEVWTRAAGAVWPPPMSPGQNPGYLSQRFGSNLWFGSKGCSGKKASSTITTGYNREVATRKN